MRITQVGGRVLTTDWIIFSGATRTGVATGEVRVVDEQNTVLAEFAAGLAPDPRVQVLLIAFAFGHLPVSFSSLGLLQPLVAGLLAWVILHEPLNLLQAVGGCAILLGIFLAS